MKPLFPPELLKRIRGLLWAAGLLLAANLLLLTVFVVPALREQAVLTEAASRKERALAAHQADESGLERVVAVYRENERGLGAFAKRLLGKKEFERFLGELFDFSQQAGLMLERINYDPEMHDKPGILEYRLRFNVGGRYEQIRKFISLLENSPRMIAIRTLRFSGKEKEGEGISVTMEIDTFFRLEET